MGRLIFRAFQCEMELDYITVSRVLLVPVVNVCESSKNWFQLIYQNWSWLQYCVLLPCVWLRNILRKWFVTTVLTLPIRVLQPQNFVRIFCNYSEAIFRRKEYLTAGVDLGEANETFASSPPVRALHLLFTLLYMNHYGATFNKIWRSHVFKIKLEIMYRCASTVLSP